MRDDDSGGHPTESLPVEGRGSVDQGGDARPFVLARFPIDLLGSLFRHGRRSLARDLGSVRVTPGERRALARRGIDDDTTRRFLAWRRSLLLATIVPAAIATVVRAGSLTNLEFEGMTTLGILAITLQLSAACVLPVTAGFAQATWASPARSRRILLWGWAVAFGVPVLIALLPARWQMHLEATDVQDVHVERAIVGVVYGVMDFVFVLPIILSLLPGMVRASVTVKSVFPESILPGWFLVAIAPLHMGLMLLLFVLVNHVAGNWLLVAGVFALVASPMPYILGAGLLVRPLTTPGDRRNLARLRLASLFARLLGCGLLVAFPLTASVMGRKLVGGGDAYLDVRDYVHHLFDFGIDLVGRAMYTTALAADFFLLMHLSLWRQTRRFAESAEAVEHDRTMEAMRAALLPERPRS